MIRTTSHTEPYRTTFKNDNHTAIADAPLTKGGGETGFGPHELLEAALATCINMSIRMAAAKRNISLKNVEASVRLDRNQPHAAIFEYTTAITGDITTEQRQLLNDAVRTCPVRQTLCRTLEFKEVI